MKSILYYFYHLHVKFDFSFCPNFYSNWITTPLLHPKPFYTSYSPPPPCFPIITALYFSNI